MRKDTVSIDYSCCDENIKERINDMFVDKYGYNPYDVIIGNIKMLKGLGEILIEVYKEELDAREERKGS